MVKAAILHEGPTDKEFIESLLAHLDLNYDRFHFIKFDYKSNFFKTDSPKYSLLKQQIKAGQIDKILFIVDSDYKENDLRYGGFDNTEIQLNKVIEELDFQDIARSYIVCDPDTKTGYLESLILASLPEQKRKCIECFIECSEINSKQIHKIIINRLYSIAYPDPPYNFIHPNFDVLKAELKNLFI
jgi:hypothetical protein